MPQVNCRTLAFCVALSGLLHHTQPRSCVYDSFGRCQTTCSACRAIVPVVIELVTVQAQRPVPYTEAPMSTSPSSLLAMARLQTRRLTTAADTPVLH